jgi:hypothetical protein
MHFTDFLAMFTHFALSMLCGIVGFNSPQAYRPILLALVIFFAVLAFRKISDATIGVYGSETFAMFIIIYLSHMTCALCVEKYVLPKKEGVVFDWIGGYRMLFNARWLGTNRQAPDIKGPSKAVADSDKTSEQRQEEYSRDPSKKFRTMFRSPRAIFLRNRIISFAATLAIERIYSYAVSDIVPQYVDGLDMMDFLPTKEVYWRRIANVTLRETIIRAWIVTYFVGYSVMLYSTIHDLFAIFFVGTGFDQPSDWPTLYGDIREATSIRNFWAKFWHRLVYRSYTSYGVWIVKNILRLPRTSFIGKLFINAYVFTMSGLVHALAIRQLGYSCGDYQEVRFYVTNFVAILVETGALSAFKKLTGGYQVNNTVSKVIGYSWVFMFLFTALPKSQFPKVWCTPA